VSGIVKRAGSSSDEAIFENVVDLRARARARMPRIPDPGPMREEALAMWSRRMRKEYASARLFEALATQIREADLGAALEQECLSFAVEERHHAVLCGAVVEALGGAAMFTMREDAELAKHEDVSPREALLRNVVAVSCMSETVAVALLGAERVAMPRGELSALLTRIYADEIGHARFGWKLVGVLAPKLAPDARERTNEYLREAFGHLEMHELMHINARANPPPAGSAFGLRNGAAARRLFYDTVERMIAPTLDAVGLGATRAWAMRLSRRGASAA
jgi:hypothetical protein